MQNTIWDYISVSFKALYMICRYGMKESLERAKREGVQADIELKESLRRLTATLK